MPATQQKSQGVGTMDMGTLMELEGYAWTPQRMIQLLDSEELESMPEGGIWDEDDVVKVKALFNAHRWWIPSNPAFNPQRTSQELADMVRFEGRSQSFLQHWAKMDPVVLLTWMVGEEDMEMRRVLRFVICQKIADEMRALKSR